MAQSIESTIVAALQRKYGSAVSSSRTYENEAGKEILEFSVEYPTPKPVGQIQKQARKAAITFNAGVWPKKLKDRVINFFENNL